MIQNDITWYNMWRIYFGMIWYDTRYDTMHHIIWYVLWHTMTWNNMVSNMKHDDLISYDMKRNEDYILLENLLGYHMLYLDTLRYAIVNHNCQTWYNIRPHSMWYARYAIVNYNCQNMI